MGATLLPDLINHLRASACRDSLDIAVISHAAHRGQQVTVATLAQFCTDNIPPSPAIIIIGPTVHFHAQYQWFATTPAATRAPSALTA